MIYATNIVKFFKHFARRTDISFTNKFFSHLRMTYHTNLDKKFQQSKSVDT
jgi:hypothetical protein